jgi:hypothetical protein
MQRLVVILVAVFGLADTAYPQSAYIPDPIDQEATAAFNEFQEHLHRPHAKSVTYDAATDSYWITPKTGKKISMERSQFDEEIWRPYYRSHDVPKAVATPNKLVATATPVSTVSVSNSPEPVDRPSVSSSLEPLDTPSVSTSPVQSSSSSDAFSITVGIVVAGAIFLIGLIVVRAIFVGLLKSVGRSAVSAKGPLPTEPTTADFGRQMLILTALENNQASALKEADFRYCLDGYVPRKGEVVLWAFPNTKYYHLGTHTEWQGASVGVNFRVAKGLWVRTGQQRGHRVSHQSMDYKGTGTLVLTNQGFSFIGAETIRVVFSHIVVFKQYSDGIGFETDRVRNNKYLFGNLHTSSTVFIKDAVDVLSGEKSKLLPREKALADANNPDDSPVL